MVAPVAVAPGATTAFLVRADLSSTELALLARAAIDPAGLDLDQIAFDEGGGVVDLNLAVPFLPGMDEVRVDAARLVVHGVDAELAIDGWHAVAGPGGADGAQGVFVCLDVPARLVRLRISEVTVPAGAFLVVRAATLASSGAPSAGAPLAADRGFSTGPMLPPPLARLTVSGAGTGQLTVRIPASAGQSWLVQYATGDQLDTLTPVAGAPTVSAVTVLPAPEDVSLILQAGDGAAEQSLWQHPGPVLAAAADQVADFAPAAGRRLNLALAALNTAGDDAVALALPLRFASARAGTLGVRNRQLDVRYLARMTGTKPLELTLDGGWHDLGLDAPTRSPISSELRLTAKHLGLRVNPGSGIPPMMSPPGGVRVNSARLVAGSVSWIDSSAENPGHHTQPIAEIRLFVAAGTASEVVCELRRDVAGSPGPALAPPVVRQLGPSSPDWLSIPFAAPVSVGGSATLWVSARTTKGDVFWFAAEGGAETAKVSADAGVSWGAVEPALGPVGAPLIQLLDQVDPGTSPPPSIQLRIGSAPSGRLDLVPGAASGEYASAPSAELPPELSAVLGSVAATARTTTVVSAWSPDVLDLTIAAITGSYRA